jgi:hypothetical protein
MKYKLFFLTLFAAASFVARANSTDPTAEGNKKADIAGGVLHTDTKKPLSNVSVTVYSTTKKEKVAYTDAHGYYSFNELKGGTYRLVFEKVIYFLLCFIQFVICLRSDENSSWFEC